MYIDDIGKVVLLGFTAPTTTFSTILWSSGGYIQRGDRPIPPNGNT